jgi:hypothetical protein
MALKKPRYTYEINGGLVIAEQISLSGVSPAYGRLAPLDALQELPRLHVHGAADAS